MATSVSFVGQPLEEVTTPAFVLDRAVVTRNCQAMQDTCRTLGVSLRAQTKTHKTLEGALLQTGGTGRGLVCSTLQECEFYADGGCDDVLFGHPLQRHHIARVTRLVSRLDQFHVLVDSDAAVQLLVRTAPPAGKAWSVYLKVDCGKGRAGVWHEAVGDAVSMVTALLSRPHVVFRGVYTHCGDTYAAETKEQLEEIRNRNIARLLRFVSSLEEGTGRPCPVVGVGSTPSCRRPCQEMSKLTELHPGNYVFLDVQQHLLGSCSLDDIACSVVTRVVGHYPRRNQLLVDCGFTGLTKQGWGRMETGYGIIKGNNNLKLCCLDQEHGFVEPLDPNTTLDYSKYPVGSLLYILPYHSCATAAMYDRYFVVEDGVVTEEWRPTRGW